MARPNKKTAWQSAKRYTFTVAFTKNPVVHTFLELHGMEAMLPEFERLLVASGHFAAKRDTQISLAQSALGITPALAPMTKIAAGFSEKSADTPLSNQKISQTQTPFDQGPPPTESASEKNSIPLSVAERVAPPVPEPFVRDVRSGSILDDE